MRKLLILCLLFSLPYFGKAQVSVTITTTSVTCNGGTNGSATAIPTGGTPPYTYSWAPNGATTATATGLSAGTYTVTVTDNIGGTGSQTCVITQPNALSVTLSNSTGNTVCAGTTVQFYCTVMGGSPPYTYNWSFPGGTPPSSTVQNPSTTYNTAGTYSAIGTVADANGCVMSATIVMTVAPNPTITVTPSTTSICSPNTAMLSSSGATTYTWVPGNLTGSPVYVSPASTTTYTVTGTSANGCIGTATATVNVNQPSVGGTLSGSAVACTTTNNGTLTVSGYTGSIIRWEMSTDGGVTWVNIVNTNPTYNYSNLATTTIFRVRVQNASCTAVYSSTATITVGSPSVSTSEIPATCNGFGSVICTPSGGTPPYTYLWTPGNSTTPTTMEFANQLYTVVVTDANGCTAQGSQMLTDSCDYVWPGDANDDAVADNVDILDIGIANGATGTTRANASLTWIGQPSTAWGQTLLSGTDYKWVDCDGNAVINPIDTQAVVLNYGSVHNNRIGAPVFSSVGPDVIISFDQDSIGAGQTGTMTLALGSASNPASNVYGLAFRLNYDANQIQTSSLGMSGGTTWFGTPGSDQMRVVLHPNATMGYVDVAITKLDQQDVSGQGTIGTIYYTATNNLFGTGNSTPVNFTVTNVLLVNSTGASQPIGNVIGDTVEVCDPAIITTIDNSAAVQSAVYPNPASENIFVNVPNGAPMIITIEDLSGRIVYSQQQLPGTNSISTVNFPSGIYILRTADQNGNSSAQKITIAH